MRDARAGREESGGATVPVAPGPQLDRRSDLAPNPSRASWQDAICQVVTGSGGVSWDPGL